MSKKKNENRVPLRILPFVVRHWSLQELGWFDINLINCPRIRADGPPEGLKLEIRCNWNFTNFHFCIGCEPYPARFARIWGWRSSFVELLQRLSWESLEICWRIEFTSWPKPWMNYAEAFWFSLGRPSAGKKFGGMVLALFSAASRVDPTLGCRRNQSLAVICLDKLSMLMFNSIVLTPMGSE